MDKVIKNEHKTVFGFDYRGVLPIIALGITLLTDLLVPNSQEAKYRELTNFRDVITFFFVVSIILFTITLFHDRGTGEQSQSTLTG